MAETRRIVIEVTPGTPGFKLRAGNIFPAKNPWGEERTVENRRELQIEVDSLLDAVEEKEEERKREIKALEAVTANADLPDEIKELALRKLRELVPGTTATV